MMVEQDKTHWPWFVTHIGLLWLLAVIVATLAAFISTWLAGGLIVGCSLFVWWNARRLIKKYNLPTGMSVRMR